MLSGQIADAMVREINAQSGRAGHRASRCRWRSRPATTPTTPSSTRSAGTSGSSTAATIRVDSGNLSKYEGVADDNAPYYDPAY